MLDVGTIPLHNSISRIVKAMENEERIGGACGEIEVFEPTKEELGYPLKAQEGRKLSCFQKNF